jgi:hypothetical protein
VGAAHLREPVRLTLHNAELAGRDALEQLLQRRVDHLGRAAQAVHQPEADDRAALAHQRARGDRVRLARRDPVGDEPAERGERVEACVEHAAAGHLQHHVDALAEVGLDQRLGQVLARDVDGRVGAELERQRALLLRRRRRDHAARPQRLAELHGERADAAGRGVDDDALARLEVRRRAVQVPRGESLEQQRDRRAVADAVGDGERRRSGRGDVLRVAAGADERHDPLAGAEPVGVLLDDPGDLGARDERQLVAREVRVLARVGVGEVDARARDPHQEVVLARLRLRRILGKLQHLGPAPLADPDRSHRRNLVPRGGSPSAEESAPPAPTV